MNYSSPLKDLIEITDRLRQWDGATPPEHSCALCGMFSCSKEQEELEWRIDHGKELRVICEDLLKIAREIV